MHVKLWGKYGWFMIHRLAYLCGKDKECADLFISFINEIRLALPCPICRNHFRQFLVKNPINKNRNRLFQWTVDAHNNVNNMYSKSGNFRRRYTYKECDKIYNDCNPLTEQLFYIMFDENCEAICKTCGGGKNVKKLEGCKKRMCRIKELIKQIKGKKNKKCYHDCIKPKLKKSTVNAVREFMRRYNAAEASRRNSRPKNIRNHLLKNKMIQYYKKKGMNISQIIKKL